MTKRIGEALEEELGLIKAFARFSSNYSRTSLSSESDIEYIHPRGGFAPGSKGISWSIYRCGGSTEASFLEKSGRKSWYSGGTNFSAGSILGSSSGREARTQIMDLVCLVAILIAAHEMSAIL